MHASRCRRHEMADALEPTDPVFAAWMRTHGRLAQLKDSHVERLERATQAVSGPGRAEVLESMYNRLDPTPKGMRSAVITRSTFFTHIPPSAAPTYTEAEQAAMQRAAALEHQQRRLLAQQPAFARIDPGPLGTACSAVCKFSQDQCEVHVFVALPSPGTPTSALRVHVAPEALSVVVDSPEGPVELVGGALWSPVEPAECHWQRTDDIVELTLAKAYRRGRYPPGGSLADTWWWALLVGAPRIAGQYPPPEYYSAMCGERSPVGMLSHGALLHDG